MESRDSLSSAYYFASSLFKDPEKTLQNTWKGASAPLGPENGAAHVFGGLGATLTAFSVVPFNPVGVGFGLFEMANAGGRYLAIGEDLSNGGNGQLPPPEFPHA